MLLLDCQEWADDALKGSIVTLRLVTAVTATAPKRKLF